MRKLTLFLLSGCVMGHLNAETVFPSEKGTVWRYEMTQQFGEGVRPSEGADKIDKEGKLRLPVVLFAAGTEKIDGVDTVKYETHRLSAVSLVEYLAVTDKAVTAYARAGDEGEKFNLNPPQRVLNFPVRVGEKWKYKGQVGDIETEQTYEIVGQESVNVPAGKFDAFHLRITQLSPTPPDITDDRWFVPKVGYVKIVTEMKRGDGGLLQRISLELKESPKIGERPAVTATREKKALSAVLAKELTGEPATTFPPNHPKIYVRWQGETLQKGDKIRSVWIAEDVGDVAPKNYKLDEASTTADGPRAFGTFTITKPNKGWPVGKYHVDLYRGDELVETLTFEIAK